MYWSWGNVPFDDKCIDDIQVLALVPAGANLVHAMKFYIGQIQTFQDGFTLTEEEQKRLGPDFDFNKTTIFVTAGVGIIKADMVDAQKSLASRSAGRALSFDRMSHARRSDIANPRAEVVPKTLQQTRLLRARVEEARTAGEREALLKGYGVHAHTGVAEHLKMNGSLHVPPEPMHSELQGVHSLSRHSLLPCLWHGHALISSLRRYWEASDLPIDE